MAEYGRPRFKVTYYSEHARPAGHAFKSFATRHAAVGEAALLSRDDKASRIEVKYQATY